MHEHHHCHHHEVSEKTVKYLLISFIINILLSVAEIIGGLIAGSVSLIGDALHNTSDAFSILIAVIAFKIGRKKAVKLYRLRSSIHCTHDLLHPLSHRILL